MSKNIVDRNRKAKEFAENLVKEGYTEAAVVQVLRLAKKRFDYLISPNHE